MTDFREALSWHLRKKAVKHGKSCVCAYSEILSIGLHGKLIFIIVLIYSFTLLNQQIMLSLSVLG